MFRIKKLLIKAYAYIEFFLNLPLTLIVCSFLTVLRQVRGKLFLFPIILLVLLSVCSRVFVLAGRDYSGRCGVFSGCWGD